MFRAFGAAQNVGIFPGCLLPKLIGSFGLLFLQIYGQKLLVCRFCLVNHFLNGRVSGT